jgi:hypothetical protein
MVLKKIIFTQTTEIFYINNVTCSVKEIILHRTIGGGAPCVLCRMISFAGH